LYALDVSGVRRLASFLLQQALAFGNLDATCTKGLHLGKVLCLGTFEGEVFWLQGALLTGLCYGHDFGQSEYPPWLCWGFIE
jgi:hypothetical protein